MILQLSLWAARNSVLARILIVFAHVVLSLIAIGSGIVISVEIGQLPSWFILVFTALFFVAILAYPFQRKRDNYWKRKAMDGLLNLAGFAILLGVCNQYAMPEQATTAHDSNLQRVTVQTVSMHYEEPALIIPDLEDRKARKGFKKNLRQSLREQAKAYKNGRGNSSPLGRIMLTILAIYLAIIAFAGLMALSCLISCNGQEGLAGIVFFGGLILIIFLFVVALRIIYKKRRTRKR